MQTAALTLKFLQNILLPYLEHYPGDLEPTAVQDWAVGLG